MEVRKDKNIVALKNLQNNLAAYKKNIFTIPLVFQYNKMDLAAQGIPLLSYEALEQSLNTQLKVPSFEASALTGQNVAQTLKKIISLSIASLQKELV
jgi:signal recognition particle receptor subunit beta